MITVFRENYGSIELNLATSEEVTGVFDYYGNADQITVAGPDGLILTLPVAELPLETPGVPNDRFACFLDNLSDLPDGLYYLRGYAQDVSGNGRIITDADDVPLEWPTTVLNFQLRSGNAPRVDFRPYVLNAPMMLLEPHPSTEVLALDMFTDDTCTLIIPSTERISVHVTAYDEEVQLLFHRPSELVFLKMAEPVLVS